MQTEVFIADVSPLNDDELFKKFYDTVPEYRQNKIDKFKFRDSKNLSLGAGLLLSYALKKNGFDESKLNVKINEYGKPYFANMNNLFFSISHTATTAVCAISDNEIGVDIEQTDRSNLKLAKRFFSDKDNELINNSDNEEKTFTELWTKKESYAKFKGTTLESVLKNDSFPEVFFTTFEHDKLLTTTCTKTKESPVINFVNLTET